MFWSYLTNNQENKFLTFETCEYFDKMKLDYDSSKSNVDFGRDGDFSDIHMKKK